MFAPTDEAFSKVPPALFSELQADKNKLATVLKYHVLSGFVLGPQISDGTSATTLDGQDVNLHKTANGVSVSTVKCCTTKRKYSYSRFLPFFLNIFYFIEITIQSPIHTIRIWS